MTLDSLPDLDTSGLCLVKALSVALTCWPYRNTALRDGARTSTHNSSVAKRPQAPSEDANTLQFVVAQASEWASPWGQAASLLQGIAEFPRKMLTDRLLLRGLDVDESELLEAMDVCADAVLKISNRRDSRPRAHKDLHVLARLADSRMGARARCQLVLRLIGGAEAEEISAQITDEETEEGSAASTPRSSAPR